MKNKKILWITQTAVMLSLLVGVQFVTRPLSQFITGSFVNLILLLSVLLIGLSGGLSVAVLSPFLAALVGIGPAFPVIIPLIAIGNTALSLIAHFFRSKIIGTKKNLPIGAMGLILASAAKALFLWIAVTIVALPLIPGINERQIAMLSSAFSWPQLVTALIGSALAIIIAPVLGRVLKAV